MRILLADQDPETRQTLSEVLNRHKHEVVDVECGDMVFDVLNSELAPGIVVLNCQTSPRSTLDIIRRLTPLRIKIPLHIIIATPVDQFDATIELLSSGADDCLAKPIQEAELLARLSVGQRHLALQQDFITAVETLQTQAMQDELTGLLNRRAFFNRLESEIDRARRQQAGLALVMADVDHFKKLNDMYGHMIGDVVLAETAQRLSQITRNCDIVGRYGGEEFAACLPMISTTEEAMIACERIRLAVSETPFVTESGDLSITISVGCVVAAAMEKDLDYEALLERADAALYAAKRLGRNRSIARSFREGDETVKNK